jgi:hypothetical protein
LARITNRDITDSFIKKFEGDKPFTQGEKRMMGIYLSKTLKKDVKQYIEDNNVVTDLSVEAIIMDAIEYASMMGWKMRVMASLGYDCLPKSLEYWKIRRRSEQHNLNKVEEILPESIVKYGNTDYNKDKVKEQTPAWLNLNEW